jgi:LysM repeat protein
MSVVHVTVSHDTLPSLAEAYGHPYEWSAIWELNKILLPDPNMVLPGMEITIPADWVEIEEPPAPPVTSSARRTGSSSTD